MPVSYMTPADEFVRALVVTAGGYQYPLILAEFQSHLGRLPKITATDDGDGLFVASVSYSWDCEDITWSHTVDTIEGSDTISLEIDGSPGLIDHENAVYRAFEALTNSRDPGEKSDTSLVSLFHSIGLPIQYWPIPLAAAFKSGPAYSLNLPLLALTPLPPVPPGPGLKQ